MEVYVLTYRTIEMSSPLLVATTLEKAQSYVGGLEWQPSLDGLWVAFTPGNDILYEITRMDVV